VKDLLLICVAGLLWLALVEAHYLHERLKLWQRIAQDWEDLAWAGLPSPEEPARRRNREGGSGEAAEG